MRFSLHMTPRSIFFKSLHTFPSLSMLLIFLEQKDFVLWRIQKSDLFLTFIIIIKI